MELPRLEGGARRAVSALGALAIAAVLLSACTTGSGTLAALRERGAGGGSARPYDSLDDLLGNVQYQWNVGQPEPLTIAVVVGRFESARPGAAFTVAGADAPGGRTEDFDAPGPTWKTVEATFVVDQVISGAVDRADRVEVGLAFGPDIDPAAVEDDLRRLGRTVLFLDKSPVSGYKPQLYGTVADGTLLATVGDDGTLALPALDTDQAASLLRATPTLTALTTAVSGPRRSVTLDPSGAEVISETTDAE